MAWTDRTWVVGETASAAEFNEIRDNFRLLWREISYTEFTADIAYAGTGAQVVTSGAITYSAWPIIIEFFAPGWTPLTSAAGDTIRLFDGASELGIMASFGSATNSVVPFIHVARRLTPTAASHTYLIKALGTSGAAVKAGNGGAGLLLPGYLRILQRGS